MGTVIGVGIFGLPYLAAHGGFGPLILMFCVVTPLAIFIHRRFITIVVKTKKAHRIPGYVGKYLGPRWHRFSVGISFAGLLGSLLAYLIVGGTFIQLLLQPYALSHGAAVLIFFILGTIFLLKGTKTVAWVDTVLIALFFLFVFVFFFLALPRIDLASYSFVHWPSVLPGYGVILFSLWGLSLIPETVELGGGKAAPAQRVVTLGLLLTSVSYLVFAFFVFGVTGFTTTPDALSGFLQHFQPWAVVMGSILGLITTFTSYIALGLTLRKTLAFDIESIKGMSTPLAIVAPLAAYAIGLKSFIDVLGITGAVLLGIEGLLILVIAERIARKPRWGWVLGGRVLMVVLALGVLLEVWNFVNNKTPL